jgi:hypothetical protein
MVRRAVVAAFSAALLLGVPALASAQDPVAAAAPQADQYVFNHDSLMMGFTIAETGTAEFEAFVAKVKDVLQKSSKPERKQQAESWKLMKLETPPQGGNVTYLLVLEKVVKGASYDMFKILSEEVPPAEVQEIYKKVSPVIKGGISFTPIKIAG